MSLPARLPLLLAAAAAVTCRAESAGALQDDAAAVSESDVRVVTTLQGEDIEVDYGAAATRLAFPTCSATKIPAVIPPIPKPAAGGNPLLPKDSPTPAHALEVAMRDGVGLHTLVFFPCNIVRPQEFPTAV